MRRSTFVLSLAACAMGFPALGCTATSAQVAPPKHDPYYPASVAVSPDVAQSFLFIANANSDLRYDSGTMQVLDLAKVDALVADPAGAVARGVCCNDCFGNNRPELYVCESTKDDVPAEFVVAGGTVKMGNFAASIGAQLLANGHFRVFSAVRGDPSLTWADFDPGMGTLTCGETQAAGAFPRCDERHRLDELRGDRDLYGGLTEEPFGVYVDSLAQRVYVTHLTSGRVTLASSPDDGDPRLEDAISGLWAANRTNGSVSAVGVAARMPGERDGFVYVTSRSESRLAMVRVVDQPAAQELVRGPSTLFGGAFEGISVDGTPGDARSIAFSPDGNRGFLVSRTPAAIVAFDTSIDPSTGVPRNDLTDFVEVCAQPSTLGIIDHDPADPDDGLTGYVPCFASGQVWVVDLDRMQLRDTIEAGRGPAALAVAASRNRLYVANYADDTISVIDVAPGSPTEDKTVLRLGKPRQQEN